MDDKEEGFEEFDDDILECLDLVDSLFSSSIEDKHICSRLGKQGRIVGKYKIKDNRIKLNIKFKRFDH